MLKRGPSGRYMGINLNVQILPEMTSLFTLLFFCIKQHNTSKPGFQSVVLSLAAFLLSGVYMLFSHTEGSRAGFVDDLRDGKHTGAFNAPSI